MHLLLHAGFCVLLIVCSSSKTLAFENVIHENIIHISLLIQSASPTCGHPSAVPHYARQRQLRKP